MLCLKRSSIWTTFELIGKLESAEGPPDATKLLRYFVQQPAAPELHQNSGGAGTSVVGIVEVIESDFSNFFWELSIAEDGAGASYQMITLANKVSKVSKK